MKNKLEMENEYSVLLHRSLRWTNISLFLFLFMLFFLPIQGVYASSLQVKNVSIQMKDVSLSKVLDAVEKQSGYSFLVRNNDVNLNDKVSLNVRNESVEEILNTLLESKGLTYEIKGKRITIYRPQKVQERTATSAQQQKKVNGTVKDAKGESLIGVNVKVKGAASGTITDIDGNFTLNAKPGDVLEFSFVGYNATTAKVGNTPVIVTLQENVQNLDEVVVVGYGTTTKRSMISSVSTVKTEELANLPVTNITQGLAGRASGLIVQGSGGGINKQSTISIRGGGTPLVVIDGVIRSYSDFVQLSPEDIESLSVLKDASATAVYGSRAADGIIQLTTKKGKEGKPQLEYNFNQSWSQPSIWPDVLNSYERAEYANLARKNDGLEASFSDAAIQAMKDGSDPLSYANTDWRKLVLRDFAPQSKHSVRMTGGTENNNYYVSLGHVDQESLYKTNTHNMKLTNFRLSQSSIVKSIGLKTTATLDGYVQSTAHPYTSTASGYYYVFSHVQNKSPLLPGVNKYGLPYNISDNPVSETASDAGYIKQRNKMINGNLAIEWSLPWVEGLKVRANGNYRYSVSTNKQWRKDAAKYDWDSTNPQYDNVPMLYHSTGTGYSYTTQLFAEYNKAIKKHSFNLLAGYEATYGFSDSYWEQREKFAFPIDQIAVGSESTQTNGGSESESGRAGWIGQLKYNYDNKYFVEASMRYDGSDNFPKKHRWGTFYSGSVGWSIADEAFMQPLVEKNIFNTLKVRASYGQTGLDNWGDPFSIGRFAYMSSYNYTSTAWVVNGAYVPGFTEGAIPSPDLTWFTTDQFDMGVDFSSLNNRLYGSVDYFYYRTKGFLYSPNPLTVGYTAPLGMSLPKVSTDGEHRRAGFDFRLGYRDNIGDFTYDVSANFTKFDQLWANLPSESESSVMNPYTRQSQQTGYYGTMYHCLGYYKDAEDVKSSAKPLGSYNLTAGDLKYEDFNGDGKIDASDQIRTGNSSFPRGNYGISINLGYKGFFFNVLFQGATNFDMYLSGTTAMNSGQTAGMPVIYDFQTDYWTPTNTNASFPRLMSNSGYNGGNNYLYSDFWLINGAYLRMKDFQFGYDFKKLLLNNVKWLTKATVALSGQNIFTISDATKYGLDPENSSTENYGYPNERVYAVSVSIGF